MTFDFFHQSAQSFGIRQFAGFVVSAIVALKGLSNLAFLNKRLWDGLLFLAYLAGVLFWGLRPASRNYSKFGGFLSITSFASYDFIINFFCFIPFSYLLMSFLSGRNIKGGKVSIAVTTILIGIGISLLIEIIQFYIPGRSSSLTDIIANGLGALCGIGYYFIENNKISINSII
ncbi:VanZ family protein [Thermodesulfobacteriota bacterium]